MQALVGHARTLTEFDPAPLHAGGEAQILRSVADPQVVGKFYVPGKFPPWPKIEYLTRHTTSSTSNYSICGPIDIIYDRRAPSRPIGFTMQYEENSITLMEAFRDLRRGICSAHDGLHLARCVAEAFEEVHRDGNRVGDINDANILVAHRSGTLGRSAPFRIVLVDVDSFQVRAGSIVYRCPVGRPEFTAPELQGLRFDSVDRTEASDSFGLAVVIHRLLMKGHHPFDAGYSGLGGIPPLGTRIRRGEYPYSKNRPTHYRPKKSSPPFDALPTMLQGMFRQCFEGGHRDPYARPTAAEWSNALQRVKAADFSTSGAATPMAGGVSNVGAQINKHLQAHGRVAVFSVMTAASLAVLSGGFMALPKTSVFPKAAFRRNAAAGQPTPKLWHLLAAPRHHK